MTWASDACPEAQLSFHGKKNLKSKEKQKKKAKKGKICTFTRLESLGKAYTLFPYISAVARNKVFLFNLALKALQWQNIKKSKLQFNSHRGRSLLPWMECHPQIAVVVRRR